MSYKVPLPALEANLMLSNGLTIPQIQLGTYKIDEIEVFEATQFALQTGYRGFDSAQMHGTESHIGSVINSFLGGPGSSGLERKEIFYTTKLEFNSTDYDKVRSSIKKSVEDSGLGYVDLFLLQSPNGGKEARLTSWKALEDAVKDGEVKSVGVSNFGVRHIEELMESNPRIKPVVNQIEVHPFNTQKAIRDVCAKHGIVIQAWAPLAHASRMDHPKILELAGKYSASPAQIFMKWGVHNNMVMLPKTVNPHRMTENADLERFNILVEDMIALDALDEHLVTDWDPTEAP